LINMIGLRRKHADILACDHEGSSDRLGRGQRLWATSLAPAAVCAWKRTRITSRPAGVSFSQRLRELRARRRRA
jgi:hypothetical protein